MVDFRKWAWQRIEIISGRGLQNNSPSQSMDCGLAQSSVYRYPSLAPPVECSVCPWSSNVVISITVFV